MESEDVKQENELKEASWVVSTSIALELDSILAAIAPGRRLVLSEDIMAFVQSLPDSWVNEWSDFLGPPRSDVFVVSAMAELAGVIYEDDYSTATLAMRELSIDEALDRAESLWSKWHVRPCESLPEAERLVDVVVQGLTAAYDTLGMDMSHLQLGIRQRQQELILVTRLLSGGDLHVRFWHWLDRFFFEFYSPWRATRAEAMRLLEKRAAVELGAMEGSQDVLPLGWLPPQHPLRYVPALREALAAGRFRLCFWIEPFGVFDLISVHSSEILVSFSETGQSLEHFQTIAIDVANRVKALADPTRLSILRIIRYFGMDNTEMARFFGLSRPTVSNHAKILRAAGLIDSRQEGRQVRHRINPDALHQLFDDLVDFLDIPDENSQ
ncbi:MAG: winged helix-turn-helix transcriptional regulator [Firmicutes bacterium]|nr:winged helix-turn-helix transcriptional regulator [Bacillota bacterium]